MATSAWRVVLVVLLVLLVRVVTRVQGAPETPLGISEGIPNTTAATLSPDENATRTTEEPLPVLEEFATLTPTFRMEQVPPSYLFPFGGFPFEGNYQVYRGQLRLPTPPRDYEPLSTGNYYKLYEEERVWHSARMTCEEEGAHLVVLESSAEADMLRTYLVRKNIWKNIWKNHRNEDYHLHAGFRLGLSTVLGNYLSYERWRSMGPTGRFCGRIDSDVWLSYGDCSEWGGFVCEYEMETSSVFPRPDVESRDVNNASSGDACSRVKRTILTERGYVPLPGSNGTYIKNYGGDGSWQTANTTCIVDGAHLPVIESLEMAEAFIDYTSAAQIEAFFLGIHTDDPVTVLGGKFDHSYYQRWSNNESYHYCFYANYQSLYGSISCHGGGNFQPPINTLCQVNL